MLWVITCLQSDSKRPTNCKIPHNFSDFFRQSLSDKNYGKNCYLDNSCFYPFPILTMLRNNEKNLFQAMSWVRNIVHRGFLNLNALFKIPINILSLI